MIKLNNAYFLKWLSKDPKLNVPKIDDDDIIIYVPKKKPICLFDFIIEDISKSSLKEAIRLEAIFDKNRLQGMTFCPYRTNTVISAQIGDMMQLFSHHDRIFILKEEEVYKLYVTKESVHKLFLN